MLNGSCRCGAITYRMPKEVQHSSLCHCRDCRRSAGAPFVAWAGVPEDQLEVTGEPRTYRSAPGVERQFCPTCGTGLFYRYPEVLPGQVDVQISTLDDPGSLPPTVQVQVAERVRWMEMAHLLPAFQRFPKKDEEI